MSGPRLHFDNPEVIRWAQLELGTALRPLSAVRPRERMWRVADHLFFEVIWGKTDMARSREKQPRGDLGGLKTETLRKTEPCAVGRHLSLRLRQAQDRFVAKA